jgi:hypothetical protein
MDVRPVGYSKVGGYRAEANQTRKDGSHSQWNGYSQFWTQDSSCIEDAAAEGDLFGEELDAGDFNGDGFTDLAVGVSLEDRGDMEDGGVVHIVYGSSTGLSANNSRFRHQDSLGAYGRVEQSDWFGEDPDLGDFNGDGFADLPVGVAHEDIGATGDPGPVNVLYGSLTGVAAANNQFWDQDSPGIEDRPRNSTSSDHPKPG